MSDLSPRFVAATCRLVCTDLKVGIGDKLQQHVATTRCSDKSLRGTGEFFVKIFVAATEFCRLNKSHNFSLIWFFATCCSDKILLRRQRVSQKFSNTHEVICRCDVSPQRVAATSRRTCTHGVIWSPRLVAATCRLVCTDLKSSDDWVLCFSQKRMLSWLMIQFRWSWWFISCLCMDHTSFGPSR